APHETKYEQGENGIAEQKVVIHPESANLHRYEGSQHAGCQQPVKQSDGKIPDSDNGCRCHTRSPDNGKAIVYCAACGQHSATSQACSRSSHGNGSAWSVAGGGDEGGACGDDVQVCRLWSHQT